MPKPASPAASSGAAIAGAVSNIAATGVNLWQQNEQRKTNEAVANTHGKFLDLQDDAIRQQQEAQGIQAQVAGFHEDGVLDPKEASLLEQLSKRAAKLDLLDANQRQLRKNALLKQSLNDPALARVAHQVTNIFGGANVNPVADPQQEAIRKRMDEKFGAGQWSPVQVGEEIGRQNYMQQVSKEATENFTAASHKAAAFAAAASDDIVATISKEIKLSGAWLPESQVAVGTQLAQLHAETRAQITRASQANKAGVDSATTRKALEDVDNQFAFMKNLINEDLDPFTLQNRLEQYNTLKQATISGQMPTALQILGNSGGNAGATQSNMFELYTAMQNPRTRKLLEANGASPALLETQVAAATDWFTNGAAAVDAKMVEWFSPEFRKTIGVKLLGTKATQQDQEATDRVTAELGKPKGTDDDTKASLSAIMANIDVITAKGSEGQAELAILNHFKDFTSRQNFSPEEIAQITVVDGKIDMGALIDSHGRMGQIKTRNIRSLISEFNSAIQTAGANASEIIEAVMKANPVPEVEEEPEAEEGPTAREKNAAARKKSLSRRTPTQSQEVVQEAITDPEELSRIEAEAASLSPVDPADLIDAVDMEGVEVSDLLKKREGVRSAVYKDSLGKPTAGIGHLLTAEERAKYPIGTEIPEAQIQKWYQEDVSKATSAADAQFSELPTEDRTLRKVLVAVNFQLGTEWYKEHKNTWRLMQEGKWDEAAVEAANSRWNSQTPVRVEDLQRALRSIR